MGIIYDKLTKRNYPKLEASKLDNKSVPFLVRSCCIDLLEHMQTLKEEFEETGLISDLGNVLSKLLLAFNFHISVF